MSMTNATMMYYDDRKAYIEGLTIGLNALREFDGIEYTRKPLTGEEFVKISDLLGSDMYFDVTKMTKAEILKDVARAVLWAEIDSADIIPKSFVAEEDKRFDIAELFRR